MINEEIKQRLIDISVNYFLEYKDKMSYELIRKLCGGELYENEETTVGLLLAGTVLTHNIPITNKETKQLEIRKIGDCYYGFITFWKSNVQETLIVKRSKEGTWIDLATGQALAPMSFLNNNYEYLVSGPGGNDPDLIDKNTGLTYEVKSNYRKNNSVSGLHRAKRLMDCEGTHLVIYYVCNTPSEDIPDFRAALSRFPKFFTEEELNYSHAISEELLNVIKSGELIRAVEERLNREGFKWHPENPKELIV